MARRTPASRGAPGKPGKGKSKDATMTVVEHLTELRNRIIYSLIAVGLASVVCFVLFQHIVSFVVGPYQDATGQSGLIFTNPLDAFLTRLKVSAYGGFVLASPVVFWHLWRFVTPGLHSNEKRYAVPFVASSVILFLGGSVV